MDMIIKEGNLCNGGYQGFSSNNQTSDFSLFLIILAGSNYMPWALFSYTYLIPIMVFYIKCIRIKYFVTHETILVCPRFEIDLTAHSFVECSVEWLSVFKDLCDQRGQH